jgi:hypothetical protein
MSSSYQASKELIEKGKEGKLTRVVGSGIKGPGMFLN